MLDLEDAAELAPVLADGAHAMRANGNQPLHPRVAQSFQVGLGHLRHGEVVAQAAGGIAGAFFLAQHTEADAEVAQHAHECQHDFAALRIIGAHAAQPQAVFLGGVVERQRIRFDEFLAFAPRQAQRIAVALEVEEKLGAVLVLPLSSVHGAAPQPDDHGQVLNADRALELATAAGGALEGGFFGDMRAKQRSFGARAVFVQIASQAENDLFGVQDLAGVVSRAMLRAAPALHAAIGLEDVDARDVLTRYKPEVFVPDEGRNPAEAGPPQKHSQRAEHQVQVLGVGNEWQEDQQSQRVQPPTPAGSQPAFDKPEPRQVRDHQGEDQQRNHTGFER